MASRSPYFNFGLGLDLLLNYCTANLNTELFWERVKKYPEIIAQVVRLVGSPLKIKNTYVFPLWYCVPNTYVCIRLASWQHLFCLLKMFDYLFSLFVHFCKTFYNTYYYRFCFVKKVRDLQQNKQVLSVDHVVSEGLYLSD